MNKIRDVLKYIVIILACLFTLQTNAQVTGGAGNCVVDSDPNTITDLDTQDKKYECLRLYNTVDSSYYYYVEANVSGSRWIKEEFLTLSQISSIVGDTAAVLRSDIAANSALTLQDITDNGNSTTNAITVNELNTSNIYLDDGAPLLTANTTNGSSGLRFNVTGASSGRLFRFQDDGVTKMILNKNGRLGIGTENPAFELDVYGDIAVSAGNTFWLKAGADFALENASVTNSIRFKNSGASGLSVLDIGNGTLTIQEDANIGINTTSPSYKLDVNGTFRTTGTNYLESVATGDNTDNIALIDPLTGEVKDIAFSSIPLSDFDDTGYWNTGDFSSTDISNWNTAYSWGDHSTAGYITSQTDDQTLSLATNTLSIEDGNSVSLAAYLDNTDSQDLSLTGNTLSLTGDGTTVDLSGYLDNTDTQLTQEQVEDFAGGLFSGNTETLITATYQVVDNTLDLVVENDLSLYDNTTTDFQSDAQVKSTVSDTATVLRTYADQAEQSAKDYADANDDTGTDSQTLSFTNPNLSISGGNSVDISGVNYWTKNGSNLNFQIGNVGIGTTSPSYKLDVNGSFRTTGTNYLESVATGDNTDNIALIDPLTGEVKDIAFNQVNPWDTDGTTITRNDGSHRLILDSPVNDISLLELKNNSDNYISIRATTNTSTEIRTLTDLIFKTNGNNERLRIKQDGRVSINGKNRTLMSLSSSTGSDAGNWFNFTDQNGYVNFNWFSYYDGANWRQSGGGVFPSRIGRNSGSSMTVLSSPVQTADSIITWNEILDLDIDGNISLSGTITATGYNSTNWNTAYGWGDHSTQGYITTLTGNEAVFSSWDKDSSDDFDGAWSSLTSVPAGFADNVDDVDDADASVTNELQTWQETLDEGSTISGTNTITNNGTFKIAGAYSGFEIGFDYSHFTGFNTSLDYGEIEAKDAEVTLVHRLAADGSDIDYLKLNASGLDLAHRNGINIKDDMTLEGTLNSSSTATTLADADRLYVEQGGVFKEITASNAKSYFSPQTEISVSVENSNYNLATDFTNTPTLRKATIWVNTVSGATENSVITLPAPSATYEGVVLWITAQDNDATYSGTIGGGTNSMLNGTSYSNTITMAGGVAISAVCQQNPGDNNYYWVIY
jgi:hypothetical protein